MQLKFKNIKINISFTFFAFLTLLIYLNKVPILFFSIVFGIIHELGHLIFLKYFKVNITEFSLSLFGANIKKDLFNKIDYSKDILIYFSGPLFNLIFSFCFFICNKIKNELFFQEMFTVNLFLALFNLLPFYSFDGGKILLSLLKIKFNEKFSENIITIISVFVVIIFVPFSINLFLNNKENFSLLLLSVFMLLSLILKK